MVSTFYPMDLFAGTLDEALLGPPSADVIGAEIPVRSAIPFSSEGGDVLSGVWEAQPGLSRWEFLDRGEVILVLEGSMTVTRDGEEPLTIGAGTAAVFPLGWTGTWEITERIRKFFVVYKS